MNDSDVFTATTHWLSSLGSDFLSSLVLLGSLCVLLVGASLLITSKPVVYFAIGLYLLDGVYSIAYFFGNCNIQNIQSY